MAETHHIKKIYHTFKANLGLVSKLEARIFSSGREITRQRASWSCQIGPGGIDINSGSKTTGRTFSARSKCVAERM